MDGQIKEIIEKLSNNLVVIEHYAKDKKTYQKMIEEYYDYIKQGFEYKELRTCPVHFRFFEGGEHYIHTLELRHFVTNLMFWEPIVQLRQFDKIDESYIVDCTKISTDLIKEYADNKIIIPFRKMIGNKKLNIVLHDMLFNLSRISTDFNMLLGLSINIETFIGVANRNKRFNEIIRTKIPEGMQPNEIEKHLENLMDEQVEILKNEDNFLRPILLAGTGIKHKQLAEFAINGGLKPDLDGNTIPIPINSNFLVGGLNNVTNYYIDSLGGRKSVIMNKTVMGKSGHFARMIMLLATGEKMSKDIDDCGTLHPIEMHVKSKKHLKRLRGRYYRLKTSRQYRVIDGTENHLIGEKILLRSPITCASKEICHKCYGELYHTNKDIVSVGGYGGAKITEPLSQSILSSKHLLTTQSEKIEFNDEFYYIFSINANEIVLNTENENIDLKNYSMIINKESLQTIVAYDESEFNTYISVFYIKNKKTGELFEIREKSEKDLFLSPEMKEIIDKDRTTKDYYEIELSNIDDDERIFVVEILNNELTKPLYSIMRLLNHSKHEGCETIDEMAQMLLDLLIESKISSDSIHGEILIRPLIRSSKDILERPNFRKYKAIREYQILTVVSALQNHPSVLISLSFQDLGRQLVNPLTFRKKETSYIDPFFREKP